MARIVKVLSTVLLLAIVTSFGADISNSDVLVLFDSYGLLYKDVADGDQIPNNWSILQISAQKWYLETQSTDPKYQMPIQLPVGNYQLINGMLVSDSGDTYVNTPFGLAKLIQNGETKKVLRVSEKTSALFRVPGSYKIYYTLKGNQLEQFFELNSPVDKAFVILSTAPGEERNVYYAKMAVSAADEVSSSGRKIFILGNMEGLKNGINIRNKNIQIVRKDWNRINLNYSYSYTWQPAEYIVNIQCGDELPAGSVYVFSDISGHTVPVGTASMPDINKEGDIYVSNSWDVYHSWTLTKSTKTSGKTYIIGDLNLKGQGPTKIVINAKNLNGLTVSSGKITKQAADYAEIEFNLSGTAQIKISFNYTSD